MHVLKMRHLCGKIADKQEYKKQVFASCAGCHVSHSLKCFQE